MYSRKNGWKWTIAALASCAAAALGIALTSSAAPSPEVGRGVGGDLAHGPTMSAGSRMSTDASVGDGEVWLASGSSGLTVASGSTGTSATVSVSASMASVGVGGMNQTEAP